jgi:hypothetical protein
MDRKIIDKLTKPTGGCIKCAKCTHVRTSFFCGNKKLTNRQLYNEKGYCSEFAPKYCANMDRGKKE